MHTSRYYVDQIFSKWMRIILAHSLSITLKWMPREYIIPIPTFLQILHISLQLFLFDQLLDHVFHVFAIICAVPTSLSKATIFSRPSFSVDGFLYLVVFGSQVKDFHKAIQLCIFTISCEPKIISWVFQLSPQIVTYPFLTHVVIFLVATIVLYILVTFH